MNGNNMNYNNGGVPPVQGMPQQPMQQPQMMNNGMQQPMMPQYGQPMAPAPKKIGTGAIIGIVVGVLVVALVIYNTVIVKSLKCESTSEESGAKMTYNVVYKKRFDKPLSYKVGMTLDLSKYDEDEGGISKEDLKKFFGLDEDDDPCDDYKSGCSYKRSNIGDKYTLSVTLKGKALEQYMEDEDIKEEKFTDFDAIKERAEDSDKTTCK